MRSYSGYIRAFCVHYVHYFAVRGSPDKESHDKISNVESEMLL